MGGTGVEVAAGVEVGVEVGARVGTGVEVAVSGTMVGVRVGVMVGTDVRAATGAAAQPVTASKTNIKIELFILSTRLYAATVSKATCKCAGFGMTKFSFSNPMTCPDLSFIRTISSPVSSLTYSSCGLPNQTVSVFPVWS